MFFFFSGRATEWVPHCGSAALLERLGETQPQNGSV
jgi:hypothetical protein